jgi:hypothetical protein
VISEWCKHCDEPIASVCQGKDAEPVEGLDSVGDDGKQPIDVVLVDTLREEGNDFQKRSRIRAKFLKHGGGKRNLDCGGEALLVPRLKYARSLFLPLSRQPVYTPLVLMSNSGKKSYRKRVEVQLLQDPIDYVGTLVIFVDVIERAARGIH